jgi:two-component system, NtrC family, sensor kinase
VVGVLAALAVTLLAALTIAAIAYSKKNSLARKLRETQQICDLANDPVLVGNIVDGRILYANRAFRRMLRYEDHRALESVRIPELHPPDLVGRSAERIAEVWEKKGLIYSDLPMIDAQGERIDVELSANLIDFGGQPAILIYARDIRERLRQETAIRQQRDELQRMNQELQEAQAQLIQSEKLASLGNLAAGVAHEMNSPIGSLKANTDVSERAIVIVNEALASSELVESQPKLKRAIEVLKKTAETSKTAVDRVSQIVRSLQNFARVDEAERKKVNLHEGLDSALTLLGSELKDRVTVIRDYGDLPEIECFPVRLNLVFMNLLTNAVAAIDGKGEIRIKTRVNGDQVELSFIDTGRGIPEPLRAKLFDPSFRTKQGRVRAALGLPLSYRILQEHGGSIEVSSVEGKGSTFTLRLPTAQRPSIPARST